jgi:hypothetical protein
MNPAVHGRDLNDITNNEDGHTKRHALSTTPPISSAILLLEVEKVMKIPDTY